MNHELILNDIFFERRPTSLTSFLISFLASWVFVSHWLVCFFVGISVSCTIFSNKLDWLIETDIKCDLWLESGCDHSARSYPITLTIRLNWTRLVSRVQLSLIGSDKIGRCDSTLTFPSDGIVYVNILEFVNFLIIVICGYSFCAYR